MTKQSRSKASVYVYRTHIFVSTMVSQQVCWIDQSGGCEDTFLKVWDRDS